MLNNIYDFLNSIDDYLYTFRIEFLINGTTGNKNTLIK